MQIAFSTGIFRVLGVGVLVALVSAASASAEGLLTPIAPSDDACLPIEMPSADVLFAAPKKVFAHYFNRFPLSLDNKEGGADYYATQYLNPHGERDKWLAEGGFLRSRPLPVPPVEAQTFIVENL